MPYRGVQIKAADWSLTCDCENPRSLTQHYDTLTAHSEQGDASGEAQGELRAVHVVQVVGGVVGVTQVVRVVEIRISIPWRRRGGEGPSRRPGSRGDAIDDAIAKARAKLRQKRVVRGEAVRMAQALNRAELVDQAHWVAAGLRHNLA